MSTQRLHSAKSTLIDGIFKPTQKLTSTLSPRDGGVEFMAPVNMYWNKPLDLNVVLLRTYLENCCYFVAIPTHIRVYVPSFST